MHCTRSFLLIWTNVFWSWIDISWIKFPSYAVSYFWKKVHLRCLTGFSIHLCVAPFYGIAFCFTIDCVLFPQHKLIDECQWANNEHWRIQNPEKYLWWRCLQKRLTTFSCWIFSQNFHWQGLKYVSDGC